MTVNVLVLEDEQHSGSLVQEYISDWAASAANEAHSLRRNQAEPGLGAGHLKHLRGLWSPYDPDDDFAAYGPNKARLRQWASCSDEDLRDALTKYCRRRFGKELPDVVVVDLGLTSDETTTLIEAGGDRGVSEKHLAEGFFGEDTDGPVDPRDVVQTLTGFRILRAYADVVYGKSRPVIVTTGATNPLVIQHCRASGAFAVVRKPLPEQQDGVARGVPANDLNTAVKKGRVEWVDREADDGREPLAVVVNEYLSALAAEVLKAVLYSTVQIKNVAKPPMLESESPAGR